MAMHPRLSKEYSARDYDGSWDYGWGTWASMSDLTGDSSGSKRLEGVPIGTVIVDLVDAATKQLVWRGSATSTLDSEDSAEKRQDLVDKRDEEALRQVPEAKEIGRSRTRGLPDSLAFRSGRDYVLDVGAACDSAALMQLHQRARMGNRATD